MNGTDQDIRQLVGTTTEGELFDQSMNTIVSMAKIVDDINQSASTLATTLISGSTKIRATKH